MEPTELGKEMCQKQQAELNALVKDSSVRELIERLMGVSLIGFMALNFNERRLYIKFLIETVDELERLQTQK